MFLKDRYTVTKPNPRNKRASIWIVDNLTKEHLNLEEGIAKILDILDK